MVKYQCHATVESSSGRTVSYGEFSYLGECEKFYLELGHRFYANDEIKHYGNDAEGHRYYLTVDDKKTLVEYVRKCAIESNADLTNKTDEQIVTFALSYLGANIEDAIEAGLTEVGNTV